jgi:hypothetical protein
MAVKINISLEKAIDYAKKSMGLAHNIGNTYSIARLYHMLGFLNKTISSEKAKENFENGISVTNTTRSSLRAGQRLQRGRLFLFSQPETSVKVSFTFKKP